jgi:hypothetical protein
MAEKQIQTYYIGNLPQEQKKRVEELVKGETNEVKFTLPVGANFDKIDAENYFKNKGMIVNIGMSAKKSGLEITIARASSRDEVGKLLGEIKIPPQFLPKNLGDVPVLFDPAMYEFAKKWVEGQLKDEGWLNEESDRKKMLTWISAVFRDSTALEKFFNMKDDEERRNYLMDLIRKPGVAGTGAVTQEEDVKLATVFINTVMGMRADLDIYYKDILTKLSDKEKRLFELYYANLVSADPSLASTFILSVWHVLQTDPKSKKVRLESNWANLVGLQISTAERLWGANVSNYFRTMTEENVKMSKASKYMTMLAINLSLGSLLIGGLGGPDYDKNIQVAFTRAFAIGILGGVTGIVNDTVVKNLNDVRDSATEYLRKNITHRTLWDVVGAPAAALVALASGVAATAVDVTVRPFVAAWQASLVSASSKITKSLNEALEKQAKGESELNPLWNEHVVAAIFAPVAIYSYRLTGVRGKTKPVPTQTKITEPAQLEGLVKSMATNVIDSDVMDVFAEGAKVVGDKTVRELVSRCLAMHTIAMAKRLNPLQGEIDPEEVVKYYNSLDMSEKFEAWEVLKEVSLYRPLNKLIEEAEKTAKKKSAIEGINRLRKILEERNKKTIGKGSGPKVTEA